MNLSMDCQQFEELLQQRLDERLDPVTAELQTHAEHCPTCQDQLRQAKVLLQGVSVWRKKRPVPSVNLTSRVLASLPGATQPQTTSRSTEVRVGRVDPSPSHWQTVAVAVASMAALWLVFVGTRFNNDGRHDRSVAVKAPVIAPPTPVNSDSDLDAVLVSAEGAYSQLATETIEVAQDFALLWPASQTVSDSKPPPAAAAQIPADHPDPTWADELAPISDSVGNALDFLWRAAPHVEKTAT